MTLTPALSHRERGLEGKLVAEWPRWFFGWNPPSRKTKRKETSRKRKER